MRRRRGLPRTPTRVVLLAAAPPMTACLFILLQPDEEEARVAIVPHRP